MNERAHASMVGATAAGSCRATAFTGDNVASIRLERFVDDPTLLDGPAHADTRSDAHSKGAVAIWIVSAPART